MRWYSGRSPMDHLHFRLGFALGFPPRASQASGASFRGLRLSLRAGSVFARLRAASSSLAQSSSSSQDACVGSAQRLSLPRVENWGLKMSCSEHSKPMCTSARRFSFSWGEFMRFQSFFLRFSRRISRFSSPMSIDSR